MKIRLAMATVRPVSMVDNDKVFRFASLPGRNIFDVPRSLLLNADEIDMNSEIVKIVTPEDFGVRSFSCITFTRDIELPNLR